MIRQNAKRRLLVSAIPNNQNVNIMNTTNQLKSFGGNYPFKCLSSPRF